MAMKRKISPIRNLSTFESDEETDVVLEEKEIPKNEVKITITSPTDEEERWKDKNVSYLSPPPVHPEIWERYIFPQIENLTLNTDTNNAAAAAAAAANAVPKSKNDEKKYFILVSTIYSVKSSSFDDSEKMKNEKKIQVGRYNLNYSRLEIDDINSLTDWKKVNTFYHKIDSSTFDDDEEKEELLITVGMKNGRRRRGGMTTKKNN